jgi:fructan beta-fructosidase
MNNHFSIQVIKTFVFVFAASAVFASAAEPDITVADFEGANYGDWKVKGDAFGTAPAHGTLLDQKPVTGFTGKGFASSSVKGDKGTGELTSPAFTIERDYIRFLIGGADRYPTQVCIRLIVGDKVVRRAIGTPGSETLRYQQWDVRDLKSKEAIIEIVDSATTPRGHIMVDDIAQTDAQLVKPTYPITMTKSFLQVPVKNGARKTAFEILDNGQLVRTFEAELAIDGAPDWWASDDITALHGKTLTVSCKDFLPQALADKLPALFQQTDKPSFEDNLYHEAYRPQFHFTVRRGWNNDPNGLVYYNGEWHMFFQKIPFGLAVGDFRYMQWGHAVSTDLFHWTELPPAIYPVTSGIYSGGAFVDHGNKSGFGKNGEDPLIVSYTGDGERVAVGSGRALELKDIPEDPILKHKGRDPTIFRYEPGNKWIMIVYEEAEQTGYAVYDSTDLKKWRRLFCIEGGHECPQFFEMPIEGEKEKKWVVYGAVRKPVEGSSEFRFMRSAYMVGTFDGEKFVPETEFLKGVSGPAYYAAQTFANAPDGRRVMVGWLQGALYPGMPFTQGITLPMELKLRRTPEGLRMFFNPVPELDKLRGQTFEGKDLTASDANALLQKTTAELLDVDLTLSAGKSGTATLWVRGNPITWNSQTGDLSCRGTSAKLAPASVLNLRVIIDRSVLEIFPDHGVTGMSFGGNIYTSKDPLKLELPDEGRVQSLRISELKSVWN